VPDRPRVLVAVTYGFSVRYTVPTGLLDRLGEHCTPVVGLGWDDAELAGSLRAAGHEVVRLPDARLEPGYRALRKRLQVLQHHRLRSPTTRIERAYREQDYDGRTRVAATVRRWRDLWSVTRPGGATAAESVEPEAVRSGTNVAEFADALRSADVELVLSLTPYHDQDALLLWAARWAGTPSLTSVISFDNTTARERIAVRSERIVVWNRHNVDELHRGYPELGDEQVGVIGAPQFDLHHRPELVVDEAEWRSRLGIPADRPVVLYGAGPGFLVPGEAALVRLLDEGVDTGRIPGEPFLLVRRHPGDPAEPWRALSSELRHGRVVDPWAAGSNPFRGWPTHDDLVDQMSSFAHAAVHVNVSSSMTLDGAVFDRPQVGPRFVPGADVRAARQVRQLYDREHWWPITASGGLATADTPDELFAAVADGLTDPAARADGRRRMTEDLLTFTDGASTDRLIDEVRAGLGIRS